MLHVKKSPRNGNPYLEKCFVVLMGDFISLSVKLVSGILVFKMYKFCFGTQHSTKTVTLHTMLITNWSSSFENDSLKRRLVHHKT
jgi:hypothetical protein